MRIDKLLGLLGLATRSESKALLKAGRVQVNGETVRDGGKPVGESDEVILDGQRLDTRTERHLLLCKPAGVLTAAEDRRQPTVMDLLPPVYRSLNCMPVGRLDKDTTGLLLLTTDGELAHRLLAPRCHVDKVYRAKVDGALTEEDAAAFARGIPLKDFTALPAEMEIVSPDTALVTVREGKYHQVKRMFGARGRQVIALHRLRFGPLSLDGEMAPGQFRELTGEEIAALRKAAGMTE